MLRTNALPAAPLLLSQPALQVSDSGGKAGFAVTIGDASDAAFQWRRIVAPAHADPYILATTVGQVLLDRAGTSRAQRAEILQSLYANNYPKSATVFRSDARRVVEAVLSTGRPVFVITNSRTEHVAQKIKELAPRGGESRDRWRGARDVRQFRFRCHSEAGSVLA